MSVTTVTPAKLNLSQYDVIVDIRTSEVYLILCSSLRDLCFANYCFQDSIVLESMHEL